MTVTKEEKLCRGCGETKPRSEFPVNPNGNLRFRCKPCWNQYTKRTAKPKPEGHWRKLRADPSKVGRWILQDCRQYDKKRGLPEGDLTREFVDNLISTGCSYCGETELRVSLDRVDNNLGHTQANVVAACIRCNLFRRDMPFEAWLVVAPGFRAARERGLFASWSFRKKLPHRALGVRQR